MKGEVVTVESRIRVGVDDLNSPVYEAHCSDVGNVLVVPGASSDVEGSIRPDGVKVSYTLHFPKTFSGSLRGCRVKVRGEWFSVIGDPKPYTIENCPTEWCMPVEVGVVNG